MKIILALFLACLFFPEKLQAYYSVSEMKADALKKDPFIKIKVHESGDQVTFKVALRGTTNAGVYWMGTLELVDQTETQLAQIQMRAEDIRRAVFEETLQMWGWESFRPAEVFSFTVESRFLARSKFWWKTGPQNDERGIDFGSGIMQWSYLTDLVEAAKSQDLARHKIKTVEIPVPPKVKELNGWMKEYHLFDNLLQLDWLKSEIRLGRSASMRAFADREIEQAGFDAKTLKIQWLEEGKLIWVRWETFPQGQGRYSKQAHLVVQIEGQNLKEIFRDSIYAHGSAGMLNSSSVNLNIRYDSSTAGLVFVQMKTDHSVSEKKDFFHDHKFTADEGYTFYYGENTTRTMWKYRIEDGNLRFVSGERSAEKLEENYSLAAVAEAFNIPVAQLRRLNPNLKNSGNTSRTLRLDDRTGPYRHENDDGICGDAPCSGE